MTAQLLSFWDKGIGWVVGWIVTLVSRSLKFAFGIIWRIFLALPWLIQSFVILVFIVLLVVPILMLIVNIIKK